MRQSHRKAPQNDKGSQGIKEEMKTDAKGEAVSNEIALSVPSLMPIGEDGQVLQ